MNVLYFSSYKKFKGKKTSPEFPHELDHSGLGRQLRQDFRHVIQYCPLLKGSRYKIVGNLSRAP